MKIELTSNDARATMFALRDLGNKYEAQILKIQNKRILECDKERIMKEYKNLMDEARRISKTIEEQLYENRDNKS